MKNSFGNNTRMCFWDGQFIQRELCGVLTIHYVLIIRSKIYGVTFKRYCWNVVVWSDLNVGTNVLTIFPQCCLNIELSWILILGTNIHTTLPECCRLVRFQRWVPMLIQHCYNIVSMLPQLYHNVEFPIQFDSTTFIHTWIKIIVTRNERCHNARTNVPTTLAPTSSQLCHNVVVLASLASPVWHP